MYDIQCTKHYDTHCSSHLEGAWKVSFEEEKSRNSSFAVGERCNFTFCKYWRPVKFVDIILLGVGEIRAGLEGCCDCEKGKGGESEKKKILRPHPPHFHSLAHFHFRSPSCHPDHRQRLHHVSTSSIDAEHRETLSQVFRKRCHVFHRRTRR